MELKVKLLDWSAGVPVVMLNQKTAKKMGVRIKDRISIKTNSEDMTTIVDTIGKWVGRNEIAVTSEIRHRLNLKKGQRIDIALALAPGSLRLIQKKNLILLYLIHLLVHKFQ